MYHKINNNWICSICQRKFNTKQATTSHIHRSHTHPGISYGGKQKGSEPWNKGKTLTDSHKEKISKSQIGKPGRNLSDLEKFNISIRMSIKNPGGKSKWFDYNGVKVQGTWELNIAKKLDEQKIKWVKLKTNKDVWRYCINGKFKSYTPDFFLPETNTFLEIKGFWWGNDKQKMKHVLEQHSDKTLIIIEKDKYEKILQGELVW